MLTLCTLTQHLERSTYTKRGAWNVSAGCLSCCGQAAAEGE